MTIFIRIASEDVCPVEVSDIEQELQATYQPDKLPSYIKQHSNKVEVPNYIVAYSYEDKAHYLFTSSNGELKRYHLSKVKLIDGVNYGYFPARSCYVYKSQINNEPGSNLEKVFVPLHDENRFTNNRDFYINPSELVTDAVANAAIASMKKVSHTSDESCNDSEEDTSDNTVPFLKDSELTFGQQSHLYLNKVLDNADYFYLTLNFIVDHFSEPVKILSSVLLNDNALVNIGFSQEDKEYIEQKFLPFFKQEEIDVVKGITNVSIGSILNFYRFCVLKRIRDIDSSFSVDEENARRYAESIYKVKVGELRSIDKFSSNFWQKNKRKSEGELRSPDAEIFHALFNILGVHEGFQGSGLSILNSFTPEILVHIRNALSDYEDTLRDEKRELHFRPEYEAAYKNLQAILPLPEALDRAIKAEELFKSRYTEVWLGITNISPLHSNDVNYIDFSENVDKFIELKPDFLHSIQRVIRSVNNDFENKKKLNINLSLYFDLHVRLSGYIDLLSEQANNLNMSSAISKIKEFKQKFFELVDEVMIPIQSLILRDNILQQVIAAIRQVENVLEIYFQFAKLKNNPSKNLTVSLLQNLLTLSGDGKFINLVPVEMHSQLVSLLKLPANIEHLSTILDKEIFHSFLKSFCNEILPDEEVYSFIATLRLVRFKEIFQYIPNERIVKNIANCAQLECVLEIDDFPKRIQLLRDFVNHGILVQLVNTFNEFIEFSRKLNKTETLQERFVFVQQMQSKMHLICNTPELLKKLLALSQLSKSEKNTCLSSLVNTCEYYLRTPTEFQFFITHDQVNSNIKKYFIERLIKIGALGSLFNDWQDVSYIFEKIKMIDSSMLVRIKNALLTDLSSFIKNVDNLGYFLFHKDFSHDEKMSCLNLLKLRYHELFVDKNDLNRFIKLTTISDSYKKIILSELVEQNHLMKMVKCYSDIHLFLSYCEKFADEAVKKKFHQQCDESISSNNQSRSANQNVQDVILKLSKIDLSVIRYNTINLQCFETVSDFHLLVRSLFISHEVKNCVYERILSSHNERIDAYARHPFFVASQQNRKVVVLLAGLELIVKHFEGQGGLNFQAFLHDQVISKYYDASDSQIMTLVKNWVENLSTSFNAPLKKSVLEFVAQWKGGVSKLNIAAICNAAKAEVQPYDATQATFFTWGQLNRDGDVGRQGDRLLFNRL